MLQRLLEEANQALGRLDGLASILPDSSLFIYLYVRKEAVLSSQIEGTQSSLSDLLLFESEEAPGVPDRRRPGSIQLRGCHEPRSAPATRRVSIVAEAPFGRSTKCCSLAVAAVTNIQASSAPVRTGSAARDPATPRLYLHHPRRSRSAWALLKPFCITSRVICRC